MIEAPIFPVVIITGLSGSGKSTALDVFEDLGFYRVDGLPSSLISEMIGLIDSKAFDSSLGLVIGIDLRQEKSVTDFEESIKLFSQAGYKPSILFLEAKNSIIVQRYASTRRPHPLGSEGLGLEQALDIERTRLSSIRQTADLVIDTSDYSIHDLRRSIQSKWDAIRPSDGPVLRLHIISFGFKYGTPSEADWIFDLRFLPNPYFIDELRPLSGLEEPVASYVLGTKEGKLTYSKLLDFLRFILEQNEQEGRYRITVAIGCTGGRHRSVANAEALAKALAKDNYTISIEHRHLKLG